MGLYYKKKSLKLSTDTKSLVYCLNSNIINVNWNRLEYILELDSYSEQQILSLTLLQLVSSAPYLILATHTSPTTGKVNDLQFLLEQSTVCKVTVSTARGRTLLRSSCLWSDKQVCEEKCWAFFFRLFEAAQRGKSELHVLSASLIYY